MQRRSSLPSVGLKSKVYGRSYSQYKVYSLEQHKPFLVGMGKCWFQETNSCTSCFRRGGVDVVQGTRGIFFIW